MRSYLGHLQGIAHDGNFFYWSHTVTLVKTDQQGQALIQVEVLPSHHGDLTAVEDELYVAVELGMFNQPAGQSKPWIYLYDSDTLSLKSRKSVPQLVHGCGGIAYHEGRFLLVGGLPPTHQDNYLFEYDKDLNFIRTHCPLGIRGLAFKPLIMSTIIGGSDVTGPRIIRGFSRSTLLLNWYPIQRPTSVTVWLLQLGELMCFKDFASMIAPGETQPSGHLLDTLSIFFQPLTYLHGLLNFSRILTQDISSPASEELVVAKRCFATKINHPTLDRIGS